MTDTVYCPRPLSQEDAIAVIGLLAKLESLISTAELNDHAVNSLLMRGKRDGYLDVASDARDLRQALNDLNHRVRYYLGEYDESPVPAELSE